MATTVETEDKLVEHNELSPKNFEKVMSNESDNEIDDKKPKSEVCNLINRFNILSASR